MAGYDPTTAGLDQAIVGLDLATVGLDSATTMSLELDAAAWARQRRPQLGSLELFYFLKQLIEVGTLIGLPPLMG
jgi:hypothetical protein